MIKLITPPGMLLAVAVLAIFGTYAFLIWSIERSWFLLAGGLVAAGATYGVAMVRPWSRHLVYALTIGIFAKLGFSIHDGFTSGFYSFQYGSHAEIARSLLPTSAMAFLALTSCVIVYRQFQPARPGPTAE